MVKKDLIEQIEIEAPYELPTGWKWCKQSEVCKLVDGEKIADKEYPYLEVKYLRGTKEKSFVTSGKLIKKGTKVILVDGENSGEVFAIHEDGYMGSTFKALSIENVDENYLQYFITTKKDLYRNNKKGSAIPHLNKDLFKNMPFPLPPTLAEQQRIVKRIETMFSKLDQAQEKAQSVLDSFETRKAAILHKAFTGELTANWRKENEVSDDSWEEKLFQELIIGTPQNGMYKSKEYYGNGTKILRIDCFYDGSIVSWDLLKRLQISDEELKTYHLDLNDIVINRVNSMPYLGKSALIRKLPEKCVFESNMMRIKLQLNLLHPEYIIIFLNSTQGLLELRKNAKQAVNQASINQQDVKNVIVPVPTLPEQQEIVRILDSILEKESRAKEAAQTVLNQIALLKKSILARAFRGEL